MGINSQNKIPSCITCTPVFSIWTWLTVLAALAGLGLIVDASFTSSATYDEVAYLRVATHWWRTGDQSEITRMGSPLTFWKLQQIPVLWLLDHLGYGDWIDQPIRHQQELLPLARLGSAWIWLLAFVITISWSKSSYGPKAMTLAAWLYGLSPNLLAHGSLATMELPLVAGTTTMFYLFWRFLRTNRSLWFWIAAAGGGLTFSCKFTAILVPLILAFIWLVVCWRRGERRLNMIALQVALPMTGFLLVMLLSNGIVTGFANLSLSRSHGQHPTTERWFGSYTGNVFDHVFEVSIPQDLVGFLTQMYHQASGGPSYLFGERRMNGWWYYYLVAIAVKVPLTFWLLVAMRLAPPKWGHPKPQATADEAMLPLIFFLYMGITAIGSSRNYGVRYLLPLAPLAIVWVSVLGERCRAISPWVSILACSTVITGLVGYIVAIAGIHPHELTYFNALGGGSDGGRLILADSNLDWGQGLKSLARLQHSEPEFTDITLYYFGDTEPVHYGILGLSHVINAVRDQSQLAGIDSVKTKYLGVSASLQWGPWGPPGFFDFLDHIKPFRLTDDTTIAIYRTADLQQNSQAKAVGQRSDMTR